MCERKTDYYAANFYFGTIFLRKLKLFVSAWSRQNKVKSSSDRHEFRFAYVEPTSNRIYYIFK